MLTTCNTQDFHPLVVSKTGEKLGSDKKVLAGMFFTSDFDHTFVYHTFIARVHSLIDLINNSEWRSGHRLKRHQVENCGDGTFTSRLPLLVKYLKRLGLSEEVVSLAYNSNNKSVNQHT